MSRPGRLAGLLIAPLVGFACPWVGAEEVVEAALDNGLRVLLQEDHRSPVASLQVWYRVGSRDERVGLTGLSHYLEHMMFNLFGQDSVFSRSASLARHELLGGWCLRETYLPGIRAVTREDVRRMAERYLVAERRTTAILLPVPPAAARQ